MTSVTPIPRYPHEVTTLEPKLRYEIEADLVTAYYSALPGYGLSGYDRETCWRDYRFGMLRRACRAIRELGTLELRREVC